MQGREPVLTHVKHEFDPVFDGQSEVLILGTLPSVKSREQKFYYGHPRNRFWEVIAGLYGERRPETIEEKKALLLAHHIALWDVIAECDIEGSSDSSIRNVVPTDLSIILEHAPVRRIFANGTKAYELYQKYSSRRRAWKSVSCPPPVPPMRHSGWKGCWKHGAKLRWKKDKFTT